MIKRLLSRQRIRLPHNLSRLLIDQLKSTIQLLPGGSPSSLTIPSRLVKLCMIAQERRSLPNWMDTTRHGSSMNDARSKGPSGGLRLCRPPRSHRQTYGPASTVLLIASIIFSPILWVMDFTSMSLHWVVARLPKATKWRVPKERRLSHKDANRLLAKFG